MKLRASRNVATTALMGLAVLLMIPTAAWSQAWTPEKRSGYAWLAYGSLDVGDHLFSVDIPEGAVPPDWEGENSNGVDLGDVRFQTTFLGFGYGITSRLAVDGDIAYVSSRYRGVSPESGLDDGSRQGELQDIHLRARYNAWARPLMVTPFIGVTVPSHDYEAVGHAAPGRNLNELNVGVHLGRSLDPLLRYAYVQGTYQYSFVEKVEDISVNRANGDLVFGYVFSHLVTGRVFASWQKTFGGIDWFHHDLNDPGTFHAHDQAAEANWSRVGGGVILNLSSSWSLILNYGEVLQGINTHDSREFSIGGSWSFGGR